MQKVVIVIPTYNEREQTPRMIEALAKFFKTVKNYDMRLLYADDTSPDKTYEVVRQYMKKYPWLHLVLNKKKSGIGGGYITGFKYAMEELHADYVMEFDSDFQHRVQDIPVLLDKIKDGYDLIIGSRYVKGGSIPDDWGFMRKFLSVVGNWICRIGFLTFKIHDFTTGFKLTKVKGALDQFDFNKLYSHSFAYKIQMTAEFAKDGKKIVEVPIKFEPRKTGESKLVKNETGDFIRVIFLFQMHNPKFLRFIKFGTVGFVGYLVNAITLELFSRSSIATNLASSFASTQGTSLGILAEPSAWAASLATEMAIISNFTFNNIWTFAEVKITKPLLIVWKFIQFNLTSLGAVVIQFLVIGGAVMFFGDTRLVRQLGLIVGMPLVLTFNYVMYNLIIWKTWKLPWAKKKQ